MSSNDSFSNIGDARVTLEKEAGTQEVLVSLPSSSSVSSVAASGLTEAETQVETEAETEAGEGESYNSESLIQSSRRAFL